eukprot:COSAG06_NODE_772_length_12432_cov_119.880159_12_plen_48_part_00
MIVPMQLPSTASMEEAGQTNPHLWTLVKAGGLVDELASFFSDRSGAE